MEKYSSMTRTFQFLVITLFFTPGQFVWGFASVLPGTQLAFPSATVTASSLNMGLFDFIQDAFKNEDFDDRRVTASHILVETEDEALVVLKSIKDKNDTFENSAKSYSTCSSAQKGGSLGTFEPGTMVQEFDQVVFDPEASPVGEVVGPVLTQFGYHLIRVDDRFENQVKSDGEPFI